MSLFMTMEENATREMRNIKADVSMKRKQQKELKEAISLLEGRSDVSYAERSLTTDYYDLELMITKQLKRYEDLEFELMHV